MGYDLKQLQHTARHVINHCIDDTGRKLSTATARRIHQELVESLIVLGRKHKTQMLISPYNRQLVDFFTELDSCQITFPENTTYIVHSTGISYVKRANPSLDIFDQIDLIAARISSQCQKYEDSPLTTEEQQWVLKAFTKALGTLNYYQESLGAIDPENESLRCLFDALADRDITFPSNTSYSISKKGKCLEKTDGGDTVLYQPETEKSCIYHFRDHRNKSSKRPLIFTDYKSFADLETETLDDSSPLQSRARMA